MAIKVNVNTKAIVQKFDGVTKEVIPLLTEEIYNDTQEYVKYRDGILAASAQLHSRFKEGLIIWKTPYAARQYWEIQTAYPTHNPLATWKWFHVAKAAHLEKWIKKARALFKMLNGGGTA